jgi:hypothetical protein
MIFGSIGLLVVAGGLLAAGISESSTGFLVASFVCTVAAGALLLLTYAAARVAQGAPGPATWPLRSANGAGAPGVVYVPLQLSDEQLAELVQQQRVEPGEAKPARKSVRKGSRSRT